jgi:hypothetical protein
VGALMLWDVFQDMVDEFGLGLLTELWELFLTLFKIIPATFRFAMHG